MQFSRIDKWTTVSPLANTLNKEMNTQKKNRNRNMCKATFCVPESERNAFGSTNNARCSCAYLLCYYLASFVVCLFFFFVAVVLYITPFGCCDRAGCKNNNNSNYNKNSEPFIFIFLPADSGDDDDDDGGGSGDLSRPSTSSRKQKKTSAAGLKDHIAHNLLFFSFRFCFGSKCWYSPVNRNPNDRRNALHINYNYKYIALCVWTNYICCELL